MMRRGLTQIAAFVRHMATHFSLSALVVSGAISVCAIAGVYLALAWATPTFPMSTALYDEAAPLRPPPPGWVHIPGREGRIRRPARRDRRRAVDPLRIAALSDR